MSKSRSNTTVAVLTSTGLLVLIAMVGLILIDNKASAESSAVSTATITVPVACTMRGIGTESHTATLAPNTYSGASGSEYENGIGKTKLTAICNDDNGFSIYAIGYTGNSYDSEDHTKLVGTNTGGVIATKAYASGDTTSNWSMKLTKVTDSTESYNPQNLTIQSDTEGTFSSWHSVPASYTKVAEYHANTGSSTTDTALGVKLETTYAAYIATNQPADIYEGQVKYTMVHPYTEEPLRPQPSQSGKICYYANASDAEGTMGCQDIVKERDWSSCADTDYETYCYDSDWNEISIETLPEQDNYVDTYTLLASNFSRIGYGFAGWSDSFDYATNPNAKFYGPQETVIFSEDTLASGLSLYAVWIKSEGSFQDQSKVASVCNSLTTAPTDGTANLTSVSALTDQRDNNTYAIAKLADGNCWMIENLRLESTAEHNSDGTLAQGYGTSATYGDFGGLADAESTGFTGTYTANSLYYSGTQEGTASINIGTSNDPAYRMPRYNNLNTSTRASSPTNNSGNMYSYGNYYTWHAAIADLTYNGTNNQSTTGTSLCPAGWHLPIGGSSANASNSEFWQYGLAIMGSAPSNNSSYQGSETNANGDTATQALRKYPNNFLYSGYFARSSAYDIGSYGYYWSSTAYYSVGGYYLCLYSSNAYPGTNYDNKSYGRSIRCTIDS